MMDGNEWQAMGAEPAGAARPVYIGILQALEGGRMVPGQRLVETDLAQEHGVGRNAVREAMQHLAARGVVDLSPNRSPSIRRLDLAECLEVLDVAAAITQLVAATAARACGPEHTGMLESAMAELDAAADPAAFGHARRRFYRALLLIGGNRELQRLFPAIGMHIIHAQYRLPALQQLRCRDYRSIADAVCAGNVAAASAAAMKHVEDVRAAIIEAARPPA